MVRRLSGRSTWLLIPTVLVALAVAAPVAAQPAGTVKGVVKDDKGQPIEGAVVKVDRSDGSVQAHFETKTNKKGEYLQTGLASGGYKVMAEKDKLGSAPINFQVRAYSNQTFDLVLNMAAAAAAANVAALKGAFEEGVALSNAGKHAEAIEKFTLAATMSPACNDCYDNIGAMYAQDKTYDKAEEAFKKAIDIKADDANAYNGLANVYNAQRKFDEAAKAGAKATQLSSVLGASGGSGGNADALYNQGVALFNGGKSADARPLFEQAVQANPNHADAHYMLGMTLAGENPAKAVAEFETYLKLTPDGKNAALAKQFISALPH
jgi:tetratricopeptide (TPR) repeat protein